MVVSLRCLHPLCVLCISLIGTACTDKEVVVQNIDENTADTVLVEEVTAEPLGVEIEKNSDNFVETVDEKSSKTQGDPTTAELPKSAEVLDGTVKEVLVSGIKIISGDSFSAVDESGKRITVKLTGIQAPKIGEPLGQESADRLKACIEMDTALLLVQVAHATDREGRTLAELQSGPVHCNISQVEEGMAFMYEGENDNVSGEMNSIYKEMHDEALENKRGLWALKESYL
tara:strand:+ start:5872 stop:6561 length:690 start_codon:yes stop_codon:yes gene_type:complete